MRRLPWDVHASLAEHVTEKLPGEMDGVARRTIVRRQQPARQAGFPQVKARAGPGLRQLRHQNVEIAIEQAKQGCAALQLADERGLGHAQRRAAALHERAVWCDIDPGVVIDKARDAEKKRSDASVWLGSAHLHVVFVFWSEAAVGPMHAVSADFESRVGLL